MGQVPHGSATTTHAVRAAIQRSQATIAPLSRELGINPKTVAKWRKRQTVEDLKSGAKEPRSTVLAEAEEVVIVAFRRHTLLPLDDCLYALQPSIPHLTRSALHRCLQRHGISRLPDVEGEVLPERVPAEGLLILRDGEPGEPEVTLSPLRYHYQHWAEIEAVVQGASRDTAFDALCASIGRVLTADRTLGGLCDWVEAEAPQPVDLPVDGAASLKAAVIPIILHYSTADTLG